MNDLPELAYYPEFILFNYFDTSRVWYLIPNEIILVDPKTYNGYLIYSKLGVYVYGSKITICLNILTNGTYTPKRWYRRYVLNDVSNHIYKCEICGKPLVFHRISRGYQLNCEDINYCKGKISMDKYYQYHINFINSVESQAKGRATQFKKKGNPDDICAFYVCWVVNEYKYGITNNYLSERARMFGGSGMHYHILLTSTRINIANLECLIKIKSNKINEYFKDFKNFKMIYKESLKELNLVSTNQNKEFILNDLYNK